MSGAVVDEETETSSPFYSSAEAQQRARSIRESDTLLEQLQNATEAHRQILVRQAELIFKLRAELREIQR